MVLTKKLSATIPDKSTFSLFLYPTVALLFLLGSHWIFTSGFFGQSDYTLSVAFAALVPLATGALSVCRNRYRPRGARRAIVTPIVVVLLALLILTLGGGQTRLRSVVLAPPLIALATLGGGLMYLINHRMPKLNAAFILAVLVVSPFVFISFENTYLQHTRNTTVHTEIAIHSPARRVWDNIICVPEITGQDDEFPAFVLWLGVPRPRAARLSGEGVGEWRDASFDGGMTFIETITEWVEGEQISFTIDIDSPGQVSVANEIDNELFQVHDATYRIETVDRNRVVLHLDSRESITSSFSAYGGLWSDLVMRSLQNYVMKAIKKRAEGERSRSGIPLQPWCTRSVQEAISS